MHKPRGDVEISSSYHLCAFVKLSLVGCLLCEWIYR